MATIFHSINFSATTKKHPFHKHTHRSEKLLPDFIYDHLTVFSCNIDVFSFLFNNNSCSSICFRFFLLLENSIQFRIIVFFFGEFCWVCVCVWHSNSYLLLLLFKIIIFFCVHNKNLIHKMGISTVENGGFIFFSSFLIFFLFCS